MRFVMDPAQSVCMVDGDVWFEFSMELPPNGQAEVEAVVVWGCSFSFLICHVHFGGTSPGTGGSTLNYYR